MTKLYKISIIVSVLILSVLLVTSSFFINQSIVTHKNELNQLYTRKEELLTQQQKLEFFVSELNQTLNNEIKKNKELSNQAESATTTSVVTPPVTSSPRTVTTVTTPAKTTRAS